MDEACDPQLGGFLCSVYMGKKKRKRNSNSDDATNKQTALLKAADLAVPQLFVDLLDPSTVCGFARSLQFFELFSFFMCDESCNVDN